MTIMRSHSGRDGTARGARRGRKRYSGKEMLINVCKLVDTNVHSCRMQIVGRQWAKPKREKTECLKLLKGIQLAKATS